MVTVDTKALNLNEESQFLILDLREEEAYDKCHIKEAINYPAPNLKRDKTFPLLMKFKNALNKYIERIFFLF